VCLVLSLFSFKAQHAVLEASAGPTGGNGLVINVLKVIKTSFMFD